jgi:hypothetical protein
MYYYKHRTRQGNEELLDIIETQHQKEGQFKPPNSFLILNKALVVI